MKTISKVLMRNGMTTYVPNFNEKSNITIHDNHHYYFTCNEENMAKKMFEKFDSVLSGRVQVLNISDDWAGLTLIQECTGKGYLQNYIKSTSKLDGIIIYPYEEMFEDTTMQKIKEHITFVKDNGLHIMSVVQEKGKKYVVAKKIENELLSIIGWEHYVPLFIGPIIDVDCFSDNKSLRDALSIKQNRKLAGTHPGAFNEKSTPDWKGDFFAEQIDLTDKLFDTLQVGRFKRSPIKLPNKEQATILLANGGFDEEITLADGSIMSFKGTEFISYDIRLKMNETSEPVAEREIQRRNTSVLGLNYTNGTFIEFT